jgi:hypothetical protein
MAQSADAELYEVLVENREGNAAQDNDRRAGYALCQKLLEKNEKAIILFDEIEDIFPGRESSLWGTEKKSGALKGWTNRYFDMFIYHEYAYQFGSAIRQSSPGKYRRQHLESRQRQWFYARGYFRNEEDDVLRVL